MTCFLASARVGKCNACFAPRSGQYDHTECQKLMHQLAKSAIMPDSICETKISNWSETPVAYQPRTTRRRVNEVAVPDFPVSQ